MSNTVSGVEFSVRKGDKVPGDLRLDVYSCREKRWVPVKMELVFYLVDFMTENEEEMRAYKGHWRQHGDMYFMRACIAAVREGWRAAADRLDGQRGR